MKKRRNQFAYTYTAHHWHCTELSSQFTEFLLNACLKLNSETNILRVKLISILLLPTVLYLPPVCQGVILIYYSFILCPTFEIWELKINYYLLLAECWLCLCDCVLCIGTWRPASKYETWSPASKYETWRPASKYGTWRPACKYGIRVIMHIQILKNLKKNILRYRCKNVSVGIKLQMSLKIKVHLNLTLDGGFNEKHFK